MGKISGLIQQFNDIENGIEACATDTHAARL